MRGTIVRYEGVPVYIREIRDGDGDKILRVLFDYIPRNDDGDGDPKRKYISSKNFDISPLPMGYVNAPTGAFYCTRSPNRVQKQGLSNENFNAFTNEGKQVGFGVFTRTKEVNAMVANEYPSFAAACRALVKSPAVAFSRDFCVQRDEILTELIHIYHKGVKVGASLSGTIVLGDKFKCLKESLEELGVKVNGT